MDIHPCEACGHGTFVSEKVIYNILCVDCKIVDVACKAEFEVTKKDSELYVVSWTSRPSKLVSIDKRKIIVSDRMSHLKFSKLLEAVKQEIKKYLTKEEKSDILRL
jgi:hypothetical protein